MIFLLENNNLRNQQKKEELKNRLLSAVDSWASQILGNLKSPGNSKQRGLWDRFKSGISNLWYGRNNDQNPNYWMNRYGDDLGAEVPKESINLNIGLKQYAEMMSVVNNLEKEINMLKEADFDNLKITQMIKQAGHQLKKMLSDIVDQFSCDDENPNPGGPSGNPPRNNSANASGNEENPDGKNLSPKGPSGNPTGNSAKAKVSDNEGSDEENPPQDPEDKQGMINVMKNIPKISEDVEKYVDIMYKNNIKNAKELDEKAKDIYKNIKSGMEKLGKQTPSYENLLVQIIYLMSIKLEYGEASSMKDLIPYWIIGALDLTNNGSDQDGLVDKNTGKNKDFMNVVNHAKNLLSNAG